MGCISRAAEPLNPLAKPLQISNYQPHLASRAGPPAIVGNAHDHLPAVVGYTRDCTNHATNSAEVSPISLANLKADPITVFGTCTSLMEPEPKSKTNLIALEPKDGTYCRILF